MESCNVSKLLIFQHATGVNLVGKLPGTLAGSSNDRPFLIGAHYDTIRTTSHGADDNGSGVAAMLQVAKQITTGVQYTVLFIFLFLLSEKLIDAKI